MRIFPVILIVAVSLSGCMQAAPPASILTAADARAKVPALRAGDAGAGIVTFRPVGPVGWENPPPGDAPGPKGAKP